MLEPDSHLGTYRLIGRIGAGGMGEVWKAEDTRLGRIVAIKILPDAVATDAEAVARMRREARTAAQLYHPNIATIHAFEESEGRLFIVMEYVEGAPLTRLIRSGALSESDVCRIGMSVADALAEAHAKGIIHRDIKPDNIIVHGSRVKVLDFGIAKRVGPEPTGSDDPTAFLTKQGFIIGTVHYMSPEQALGKPLDARTDLFSLGVVLYEAATGRLPFQGETATETITKIVRDEPPVPRNVTPALAAIIRRCMRKNRDERFATAGDVAAALDRHLGQVSTLLSGSHRDTTLETTLQTTLQTKAMRAPARKWPWIAGIGALAIAAALTALMLRGRPLLSSGKAQAETTTQSVASPMASQPSGTIIEIGKSSEPAAKPTESSTASSESAGPGANTTPVTTSPPIAEPESRTETVASKPPPPPPPSTDARSADDYYNEGMRRLIEREPMVARAAFERAVAIDPHHAKAHFRLGEMALFLREFDVARRELSAANADASRLDAREVKIVALGLALLDRNREEAKRLLRELAAESPGDPDLRHFRELIGEERPRPFRRRPPPR